VCLPSTPKVPPPPPPPPAAPEKTAQSLGAPPGQEEAQRLAARLGTSALALPLQSSISIPINAPRS
jgi:hypothetical protein